MQSDTVETIASETLRSRIALALAAMGFVLPIVCWTFWMPQWLLFVACGAEFAALALGLRTRRRRRGRTAAIGAAIFFLLAVGLWTHGFPTYQRRLHATASWMKPLESSWVLQSPGKLYSIQVVAEPKLDRADSLQFQLRKGEFWVDQTFVKTFRAEVATKDFPPINSVRWYAFSVWFPPDFPTEDNRLVFAQWKGNDNEHFWQPGRGPVLAFRYRGGALTITLQHSAQKSISDPDATPDEKLFKSRDFPLGEWNDFVVQAKWSWEPDGFVNIWWNKKPIVSYSGPVGYRESVAPQFKFGLYRNDTDKTYVAFFNHVKSGPGAADVDFQVSATRQ